MSIVKPIRSEVTHPKGNGVIDRYDSVGDFVRYAKEKAQNNYVARCNALGVGFDEACDKGLNGDLSIVKAVRDKLDTIGETHFAERQEFKMVRSVYGSRVNVSDFLSGSPLCMRARKRVAREVQHVNIYVAIATNASVSHKQVLDRGIYILAFLESLKSMRISADVYLMSDVGESGSRRDSWQVIRVESNPLDLATSGFAIAHPAFSTVLTFATATTLVRFTGNAPHSWFSQTWEEYNEKFMPEILGMGPDDVYIRELKIDDPFLKDPNKWLSDALSKYVS